MHINSALCRAEHASGLLTARTDVPTSHAMRWQKWKTDKDEIEWKISHLEGQICALRDAIKNEDEKAILAAGDEIRAFGEEIAEIANRGRTAANERRVGPTIRRKATKKKRTLPQIAFMRKAATEEGALRKRGQATMVKHLQKEGVIHFWALRYRTTKAGLKELVAIDSDK